MIGWILLAIAVGLLLVGLVRERFEATPSIKAPPYDDTEAKRIFGMLSNTDQDAVIETRKQNSPGVTDTNVLKLEAARWVAKRVEWFYRTHYAPATVPITVEKVDTVFAPMPSPGGDAEKQAMKNAVKAYFVGGVGTSIKTGYADALAQLGQTAGYQTAGSSTAAAPVTAGPTAGGTAATTGTGPAATVGGSTTTGRTAGGTTGGSSVNSPAPNAGGGGKGKQVFGPTFTSLGAPINNNGGDSTRNNRYPELMGGMGDDSVRTDSGIQNPSQNWLLSQSGALPSTASLGSDPNAAYFPYSRTPGDQDLIPDPYRLSRNYSMASYSSKTDPVPFLTDFSAFSK